MNPQQPQQGKNNQSTQTRDMNEEKKLRRDWQTRRKRGQMKEGKGIEEEE